jgi:hypothetical protein
MGGELIGEILKNYGVTGIIVFVLALVAFAIFIKFITGLSFNVPWSKRRNPTLSIDAALSDNIFFTNAKFKLRFDIPSLELIPENPPLEWVYKDLIYVTIESFYYGCKHIIEVNDMNTLNGMEWSHAVKGELQRMLKSYEEKAEDFGVPNILLRKYARWVKNYTGMLTTYIDQLAHSSMYGNSVLRTNVFLLIMNLLIVTMIGDLDKLARTSGLSYRDMPLED